MSVPFRELLMERDIRRVEVPESEFETMGCNVLAVTPKKCVMVDGNPEIRRRLEAAGVEVRAVSGREICHKAAAVRPASPVVADAP